MGSFGKDEKMNTSNQKTLTLVVPFCLAGIFLLNIYCVVNSKIQDGHYQERDKRLDREIYKLNSKIYRHEVKIRNLTKAVESWQMKFKQSIKEWTKRSITGKDKNSRQKRATGSERGKPFIEFITEAIEHYVSSKLPQNVCKNKSVICPRGKKGDKGDQGMAGPKGPVGPKGRRGEKGDVGLQGEVGIRGPVGLSGTKGSKGEKGYPGKSIEKPKITAAPMTQTVLQSRDVNFTCEAQGNPEPKQEWYFHGTTQNKSRYSYPTKTSLMIKDVQFKDRGNITCVSQNILGQVNATAELIVWVKPQITIDKRIHVWGGDNVGITCNVKGNPKPDISWKRYHAARETPLPKNARFNKETSTLVINTAKLNNSGTYKCIAENTAGISQDTALLFVEAIAEVFQTCSANVNGQHWYTVNGRSGSVYSPHHPGNYADYMDCNWIIKVAPGHRVSVQFTKVDTEKSYDIVEIRDGSSTSSTLMKRFSGTVLPPHFTSSNNNVRISFKTDGGGTKTGFYLTYKVVG